VNFRSRLLSSLILLAVGCGGDDGGDKSTSDGGSLIDANLKPDGDSAVTSTGDAGVTDVSKSILPWKEGNSWTYKVTGDGEVTMKVTTIGPLEVVGGTGVNKDKLANKVTTAKGASDQTISWQVEDETGDLVIRLREQSFGAKTGLLQTDEFYDPYKIHIDGSPAHSVAGATWVQNYKDTKNDVKNGTTATTDESDVWRVDGVDQTVTVPAGTFKATVYIKGGGSNLKTYWYTPGVGKIKETGSQTEELVSYTISN